VTLLWQNQTDREQTIFDLEPGTRFISAGVEFELLYVSDVRARVKQISGTRRPTYLSMSPGTVVDSVTLLASQPHIRLVEPDVPASSTDLLDDHAPSEPNNYKFKIDGLGLVRAPLKALKRMLVAASIGVGVAALVAYLMGWI
jgi:hypothetical protein